MIRVRRGPAHGGVLGRIGVLCALAILLSSCFGSAGRDAATEDGDTAVFALLQEPDLMNPLFAIEGGADLSAGMVTEPLLEPKSDGTYEPMLATEVPTVENGGVSEDGLTVTFQLREGVTWSDGEPLTTEDLEFTYDVIRDPKSTTVAQPAFDAVKSVEATDEHTLVVRMSEVNPQYPDLFSTILPAHRFDSTVVTNRDPLAQLPLGTGPFEFTEWQSGDHISLTANDDYWRDPELPKLDGITWKITPDRESAITSLVRGEFDSLWWLLSGDLEVLNEQSAAGAVEVESADHAGLPEYLWLNHSDPDDPSKPHPVLGDPAMREAIDLAIDRESIIDTVLDGHATQEMGLVNAGQYACDYTPPAFDPDEAERILDDAGWVRGDDGVRVKDGVRASLTYATITGSQSRELYQQMVQEDLADIGIEVKIANADTNVIFAGYEEDGMLARGDYDIMMSLDGLRVPDPSEFVQLFTSAAIPGPDNPAGFTYSHWSDPEFDEVANQAATSIDVEERKRLYQQACDIFDRENVALPLYASEDAYAWNSRLSGVEADAWAGMWQSSSVAEWELQ